MIIYYFINYIKKKLVKGIHKTGGRNFLGRLCIKGQGGGNKKLYRYIDFYRRLNQFGKILKIFIDPNRTAKIGLVLYSNSLVSYMLMQVKLNINSVIYSGTLYDERIDIINNGYSLPLLYMPLFSTLSNMEQKYFDGSTIARAANVSALLISKDDKYGYFKLNSGWQLKLSIDCICSMGVMSNLNNKNLIIRKAGKNRALGWRPKVRGVAKNPCDHPHGGGNGKKSKPVIAKNAWCTVFKWTHTKNTKIDNLKRRLYKNVLNK